MAGYLYGSSIQGIQGFIFETNKLKEIAGASEIVEKLSLKEFEKFLKKFLKKFFNDKDIIEIDYIQHAAGNIKLISNKENIEQIVKFWPKYVENFAPGLTLSQAVVKFEGNLTKENIDELEQKLKTARNKATMPAELAPMAVVRSRRTGKPAVDWKDDDKKPRDMASEKKQFFGSTEVPPTLLNKCFEYNSNARTKFYPYDIEDMLPKGQESGWLAIIHADGNSLGKMIQKMGESLEKEQKDVKEAFQKFSKQLDESTVNAAKKAVNKVAYKKFGEEKGKKYPFRPVVIGGDDLTVIIRADLAIDFTKKFLKQFQEETKKNFKELVDDYNLKDFREGLTACAGIAFMKSSYPFHYGIQLAEELCGVAKKASKSINDTNVPASLMFHKVQDSFVDSFKEIEERELTPQKEIKEGDRIIEKGISFKFGPYFLDEQDGYHTIDQLQKDVQTVLEKDAPKSGIRKWLGLLYEDKNDANMWFERVKSVTTEKYISFLKNPFDTKKKDRKDNLKTTKFYDIMSLASISTAEKQTEKEGN